METRMELCQERCHRGSRRRVGIPIRKSNRRSGWSVSSAPSSAPITAPCIGLRSSDIAASAKAVLSPEMPLMLLYRYKSLPGNILAAYYVQQGKYLEARGALDHWGTLKPGCSPSAV